MAETPINPLKDFGEKVHSPLSRWSESDHLYDEKYYISFIPRERNPVKDRPLQVTEIMNRDSWEFILTDYNEIHSDAHDLRDTFSDTYTVFTMGANPVQVTISGILPFYKGSDHRIDFIYLYHTVLRGTMASKYGVFAYFDLPGTHVALDVQSFMISQSTTPSDAIMFTLTGVASSYTVFD